jgi:hypothetical protein
VTGGQRDELSTLIEVDRATADKQRAGARLDNRREGGIEFTFICGFHDQDFATDGATCRRHLSQLDLDFRFVRVHQHRNDGGLGNQFVHEPQLLRHQVNREEGHARDVAPGPVEAGDEASSDRIVADHEDDRRRRGCGLGRRRRKTIADDHGYLAAEEIDR